MMDSFNKKDKWAISQIDWLIKKVIYFSYSYYMVTPFPDNARATSLTPTRPEKSYSTKSFTQGSRIENGISQS